MNFPYPHRSMIDSNEARYKHGVLRFEQIRLCNKTVHRENVGQLVLRQIVDNL